MLVYYFVPFIVSNRYILFWVSNGHNSLTVQNQTHVYLNFFGHKDLGNHLLQLCPKVVKHPVYTHTRIYIYIYDVVKSSAYTYFISFLEGLTKHTGSQLKENCFTSACHTAESSFLQHYTIWVLHNKYTNIIFTLEYCSCHWGVHISWCNYLSHRVCFRVQEKMQS